MMTFSLATVYPGGAVAVLSALCWLAFSVIAPSALIVSCVGIYTKVIGLSAMTRILKLAVYGSLAAVFFIVIETVVVGWDAFVRLNDRKYFFEQFPTSWYRVAVNLVTWLLSCVTYRAVGKATANSGNLACPRKEGQL